MNFDWSDVMHSAATEARRQQDEFKLQMQEIVNSHEQEIERIRKEHEMIISQLLFDADERYMAFREETIKAAEETIRAQLTSRQETLETQYQTQREQLVQECELILNEKDEELQKCIETNEQQHQLNLQLDLERLYHQHHEEMEELKKEVWSAAKAEHDKQMFQALAEADCQCKLLHDEIDLIRSHLQAKDDELRSSAENMSEMDKCFVDVAREISAKHNNEISILSEENLALSHRNQRLERDLSSVQANNTSLKEELHQLDSKYRSIELKVLERDEMIRTLDQRKTDFQSCKQILDSQVSELKADNASLTKALELKTASLFELTAENKDLTSKVNTLKTQVASLCERTHQLEGECAGLKRRCSETNELLEAFEREKRRYAQEMEYRLTQKEGQIAQLVEKSNNKTEPVVVHLHGDQGDARRRSVDASSECHHLRSRLLELQRSNYRLESDLMDAKRVSQVIENNVGVDESANHVHQLQQENQSLKHIIAMMRKEMEQLSPDDKSNEDEDVPSSYTLALEQQLIQSRAYLDILLKSSDVRSRVSGEDELHFLRTRYRELHSVLDQVRDENLR
jgi:hypothetical protein